MENYIVGLLINETNQNDKEQIISHFKSTIRKLITYGQICHCVIYGKGSTGKSLFVNKLEDALDNKCWEISCLDQYQTSIEKQDFYGFEAQIIMKNNSLAIVGETQFIPRTDFERILYVTDNLQNIRRDIEHSLLHKPITNTEFEIIHFVNVFDHQSNSEFCDELDKLVTNKQFLDYFNQ